MKVLRLIIGYEIKYSLDSVSDDEQFLELNLSINLSKRCQRDVLMQIEKLITFQDIPIN